MKSTSHIKHLCITSLTMVFPPALERLDGDGNVTFFPDRLLCFEQYTKALNPEAIPKIAF